MVQQRVCNEKASKLEKLYSSLYQRRESSPFADIEACTSLKMFLPDCETAALKSCYKCQICIT